MRAKTVYSIRSRRRKPRANGESPRTWVWVVTGVVLLVMLAVAAEWHAPAGDGEARMIEIPGGTSSREITRLLHQENIIDSPFLFNLWLRWSGAETGVQAGSYMLGPGMSPREVAEHLVQGRVVDDRVRVTVPEGYTVGQVAQTLEEHELSGQEEFLAAAREAAGTRDYLPAENPKDGLAVEGYLFPDTYAFSPEESAAALVERMLDRFEEQVLPRWERGPRLPDWDLHQAMTLASIIQREAAWSEEKPMVSSVFHNRLEQGMRLQSCATVQYLLDEPRPQLTHRDLGIDSPYNTYRYPGLPPGPIASPGLHALEAALEPEETDYLYFVASGDGGHLFSETFRGHLEAREKTAE